MENDSFLDHIYTYLNKMSFAFYKIDSSQNSSTDNGQAKFSI